MVRPRSADVALYREALRDVNTLAQRDLLRSWREFDFSDAQAARDGLMDVLPLIIGDYHLAVSTVAADWYDLQRYSAEAPGRFTAIVPEVPDRSRAEVLARWGVGPLFAAEPNPALALSKIAGGLQRVVIDGARESVRRSSVQDPAARGWARAGSGGCDFCQLLIGRGFVYSEASAGFESHDGCGCVAVPEWT